MSKWWSHCLWWVWNAVDKVASPSLLKWISLSLSLSLLRNISNSDTFSYLPTREDPRRFTITWFPANIYFEAEKIAQSAVDLSYRNFAWEVSSVGQMQEPKVLAPLPCVFCASRHSHQVVPWNKFLFSLIATRVDGGGLFHRCHICIYVIYVPKYLWLAPHLLDDPFVSTFTKNK